MRGCLVSLNFGMLYFVMVYSVPYSVLTPLERRQFSYDMVREPTEEQLERYQWWEKSYFSGRPLSIEEWFLIDSSLVKPFMATIDLTQEVCFEERCFRWLELYRDLYRKTIDDIIPTELEFSHTILPFLKYAAREIDRRGILNTYGSKNALLLSFTQYLAQRLQPLAYPAIGLAMRYAKITGSVDAISNNDFTSNFVCQLQGGARRKALLGNFPLTDRLLSEITTRLVDMFAEVLDRLSSDAHLLADEFDLNINSLSKISFGLGDPHYGGRCVCQLFFGDASIMYKPKSLASDNQFRKILDWLNGHLEKPLRHFKAIDRGTYGWAECAEFRHCDNLEQVGDYYERLGSILAVLYVTGATDVHFENLIACGGTPVVVDTETIIHRPFPRPSKASQAYWLWHHLAVRDMTVFGIGLLPDLILTPDGNTFDLSGAGSLGSQAAPFQQPQFDGFNDGAPQISYKTAMLDAKDNMPIHDGGQQPIFNYSENVLKGFGAAYEAFLKHRSILLTEDGLLTNLADIDMRWVARPTTEYALILRSSYHPSCMRDGYERDVSFSSLIDNVVDAPHLPKLLPFEVSDLWKSDIPYFKASGQDCALRDGYGNTVDTSFFDVDQKTYLRERLMRLSHDDMILQKKIIGGAITARQTTGGPEQPSYPIPSDRRRVETDEILSVLSELEHDLSSEAILIDDTPTWCAPVQRGFENYSYDVIGWSLYNGVSGIGLFYAEFARSCVENGRCYEFAERILNSLCNRLEASGQGQNVSVFEGLTGEIYAATRMAKCLNKEAHGLRKALRMVAAELDHTGQSDVISGGAGIILAMRCLLESPFRNNALDIIERCARRLLESAHISADRASWPSGPENLHLTGFAHGTSGIAVALKIAGDLLNDRTLHELALKALAFERHTFDMSLQNWKDQRPNSSVSTAWCHGSSGIALSRPLLREILSDDAFTHDMEAAVEAIAQNGAGGSHCLCHGSIGNALILNRCGDKGKELAARLVSKTIAEFKAQGRWRCGVGGYMDTPSLMLGKAGIALGLMEYLYGPRIPSVLLLES